jgi:hypothetical protein
MSDHRGWDSPMMNAAKHVIRRNINTDLAAVHEAGVAGSEKQSRRCDFLRASELLARNG